MQLFQKSMHGATFQIKIDLNKINKIIDFMKYDPEYVGEYSEKVNGYEEKLEASDIYKDIEDLEKKLNELSETDSGREELFNAGVLKKNKRWNKKTKPTLYQCLNGRYVDEYYGWFHYALRFVPIDETNAELILEEIVTHY